MLTKWHILKNFAVWMLISTWLQNLGLGINTQHIFPCVLLLRSVAFRAPESKVLNSKNIAQPRA